MELPLSEIADRWTILCLKVKRLPNDNTLVEVFAIFTAELEQQMRRLSSDKQTKLRNYLGELYTHNESIWNLEYDLRAGKVDEERDLEKIGRRAIAIRDHNKKRLAVKNKIALLVAQKYGLDKKIDHGSE